MLKATPASFNCKVLGRKWVFILCMLGANFPTAELRLGGRLLVCHSPVLSGWVTKLLI